MRKFLRHALLVSLATVQLCAPVASAFAGDSGGDPDEELRQAYIASEYTYCDAEVLSTAWSKSIDEAKAHIGWKLTEGSRDILETELSVARSDAMRAGNLCYYQAAGFAYEDAEALAVLWGIDVFEAKARISYKLGQQEQAVLAEELERAGVIGHPDTGGEGDESQVAEDAQAEDLRSFFASKYQYCDALELSAFWTVSLEEAKAAIGYKVRNGWTDALEQTMHEATEAAYRRGEYCYVDQGPFSRQDIALIAKGMDVEMAIALARVNDMLRDGQAAELEEELRKLKTP